MNEEMKEGFVNMRLFVRLLHATIMIMLSGSFLRFIMRAEYTPAILCFLALILIVGGQGVFSHLTRISTMIEMVAKKAFMENMNASVGRPSPGQIDRMLRCDCDGCRAMRTRFDLTDRIGLDSLLTPEEEAEEDKLMGG